MRGLIHRRDLVGHVSWVQWMVVDILYQKKRNMPSITPRLSCLFLTEFVVTGKPTFRIDQGFVQSWRVCALEVFMGPLSSLGNQCLTDDLSQNRAEIIFIDQE